MAAIGLPTSKTCPGKRGPIPGQIPVSEPKKALGLSKRPAEPNFRFQPITEDRDVSCHPLCGCIPHRDVGVESLQAAFITNQHSLIVGGLAVKIAGWEK